jgi:fimbrial isopeptide formation D2 family protein
MGSRRITTLVLGMVLCLTIPAILRAQNTPTNTPTSTASKTPTNTPSSTYTHTPTGTPTDSPTPTPSFTPNLTLTPPCGGAADVLGVTTGNFLGGTSDTVRASMFTLNTPATVYSLWLESGNAGISVVTGIYQGAASNIGNLIVQSAPQPVLNGWNGFPITPTYLNAGNYWLAYMYNTTSYDVYDTSSTKADTLAYTSASVTFSTMPGTFPTPSYDTPPANTQTPNSYSYDSIYAVYCAAPTLTPTPSNTPTYSNTPTSSPTLTVTFTPTNTGTIFTNTPSPTNTLTPTLTPSVTNTFTPTNTPNPSLTPDCGAAAVSFGDTDTCCEASTVISTTAMRACRYTLSQSGTVETMAMYLPAQDAGLFYMEVGLYTNNSSTTQIGSLLTESVTYQTSVAGWNLFQVPAVQVTAGDYWLAYLYSGPVSSFAIISQTLAPSGNDLPSGLSSANYSPLGTFAFPASGSVTQYVADFYEPIVANLCPGYVSTSTPTNSPTITLTPSPTPTATSPCGASATYFGSTNTSGGAITLQSEELLAYANSLPVDGTVYGISLYATAYDANDLAEVALYSSQGTTMGALIADANPQTLTAGWNNFSLPASPVTAGNYWLTYLFQAPVGYSIVYQTPTPGVTPPTLAYDLGVTTTVFPASAASWGASLAYTNTILGPIVANYCPGSINTATPTNSPTLTPTSTISATPTNSPSFTPSGTPTFTGTSTATATVTNTPTITLTPTNTPSSTTSGTPTWTGTATASPTITDTPTITPTYTESMTPTASPSYTPSGTPTMTETPSPTSTITNTPTFTPSFTASGTPTETPSFTPSGTPTATGVYTDTATTTFTPSLTPTSTASMTPTATCTASPSSTGTPVATQTATRTATSTPTFSPSSTPSLTPTATPSSTSSGTATWTPSPTWTPTPGANISKSSSEPVANVNDTLTYTLTLNVTGGAVTNVVITDVLPASLTFVGFGNSAGAVTTSLNPLGWSFTSLNPGTYSITYQAQVAGNAPAGSVISNQAQLSYNGLTSPKTSTDSVTVAQTAPIAYPNPVRGGGPVELQVALNQPQDYLAVKVFTTSFRKVYGDTVKSVSAGVFLYGLDTTHFEGGAAANGLYYVVISTPSNRWIVKLLILK